MKELLQSQLFDLQQEKDYMVIKNHVKFSYKKDLEQFIYYYNTWKYTIINSPNVKDIEKRGKDFHLDHIIPIKIGYKYNISPQIIGSLPNLRIIEVMMDSVYIYCFIVFSFALKTPSPQGSYNVK